MTRVVYTIGHSNGTTERLLALLNQHGITAVADVRSQPYSRFNPQFNRETLLGELKTAGIGYVFLGQELWSAAPMIPLATGMGERSIHSSPRPQRFSWGSSACSPGWKRFESRFCVPRRSLLRATGRF